MTTSRSPLTAAITALLTLDAGAQATAVRAADYFRAVAARYAAERRDGRSDDYAMSIAFGLTVVPDGIGVNPMTDPTAAEESIVRTLAARTVPAVPTDTGRFHGPFRVDDATMGTLRRIREIRRESGASCVAFARGVGRGRIVVRFGHRDRRHAFAARLLAEGMSFCYPADDPRALYVRPSTRYAAL